MSREEARTQTACVAELSRRLSAEPRLQAELQRARRHFFGLDADQLASDAAEHRFAEWFLLERESETLGAVPATLPPYDAAASDLEGSIAGVFLVQSEGATITARDVQNEEIVELASNGAPLAVGDLVVGRLYPASGERWLPSVAASVLRPGNDIAAAFDRDLRRLHLERRLQQVELEHLLLRQREGPGVGAMPADADAVPAAPLEHLEADLEQLLTVAGVEVSATELSQQLGAIDRPGPVIGPLLDELAFKTDVDLERARQLLMAIWNARHASPPPSTEDASEPVQPYPGETLGERLVRTLDQGLHDRRDVEELFAQLERMAGIDGDADADDGDDSDDADGGDWAPAEADDETDSAELAEGEPTDGDLADGDLADGDPGDLAPLVTEYLWDMKRGDDEATAALTMWVELQRNAPVPQTDFESIASIDLMRLLLHVYIGSLPARRAAGVRAAFDELRRFYDWVAANHEIDRRSVLEACHGSLLDQLDRLHAASAALTTPGRPDLRPGIMQIEDVGETGFGARDDDGEHHWLETGTDVAANLRVGDLVLGALGEPAAGSGHRQLSGLVVVLPVDARVLME